MSEQVRQGKDHQDHADMLLLSVSIPGTYLIRLSYCL